jgi:3-dehydroquinate synthetase
MPVVRKWIQFIKSHFPEIILPINKDVFLDFLHADKKKSASRILCVLLNESGKPQIDFAVEEEAVLTALESVLVNSFDTVS